MSVTEEKMYPVRVGGLNTEALSVLWVVELRKLSKREEKASENRSLRPD